MRFIIIFCVYDYHVQNSTFVQKARVDLSRILAFAVEIRRFFSDFGTVGAFGEYDSVKSKDVML